MSQEEKESIDKPKMQSLDDLLKSLDEEVEENVVAQELDDEDKLDSMLDNLIADEEEINEEEE
jgi:translocation protein SEC62